MSTTYNYALNAISPDFTALNFANYCTQLLLDPIAIDAVNAAAKPLGNYVTLLDAVDDVDFAQAALPAFEELVPRLTACRNCKRALKFTLHLQSLAQASASASATTEPVPASPQWTLDKLFAYTKSIIGDRELYKLVQRSLANSAIIAALNATVREINAQENALRFGTTFEPTLDTTYSFNLAIYRHANEVLADTISVYDQPMTIQSAAALLVSPRETSDTLIGLIAEASNLPKETLALLARQSAEVRIKRIKANLPAAITMLEQDLNGPVLPLSRSSDALAFTLALRTIRALAKAKTAVLNTAVRTGRLDQLGLFTIADSVYRQLREFARSYATVDVLAQFPSVNVLDEACEAYERIMPVK